MASIELDEFANDVIRAIDRMDQITNANVALTTALLNAVREHDPEFTAVVLACLETLRKNIDEGEITREMLDRGVSVLKHGAPPDLRLV